MLVANRIRDGVRVVASEERRDEGPWCCPLCTAQVSLKKGQIKIHHFAHYPPFSCEYGSGESEEHRRCKTAIYEAMRLIPGASQWELERSLGSVRPDVSGYVGDVPVAVEVQASSLGLDRIIYRTKEYATKGIFVLWVVPWHGSRMEKFDEDGDERFAPSVWEKWLHTLYFGRAYYWLEGVDILPIHFDKHWLWVEATEWGGGYSRVSKRFRDVKPAPYRVSIFDMKSSDRNAWAGGKMDIPQSKIWIDGLPRWWEEKTSGFRP